MHVVMLTCCHTQWLTISDTSIRTLETSLTPRFVTYNSHQISRESTSDITKNTQYPISLFVPRLTAHVIHASQITRSSHRNPRAHSASTSRASRPRHPLSMWLPGATRGPPRKAAGGLTSRSNPSHLGEISRRTASDPTHPPSYIQHCVPSLLPRQHVCSESARGT